MFKKTLVLPRKEASQDHTQIVWGWWGYGLCFRCGLRPAAQSQRMTRRSNCWTSFGRILLRAPKHMLSKLPNDRALLHTLHLKSRGGEHLACKPHTAHRRSQSAVLQHPYFFFKLALKVPLLPLGTEILTCFDPLTPPSILGQGMCHGTISSAHDPLWTLLE